MALNLPYSNEEFLRIVKLADGVSNRNLLDNGYFADPINQRGQTSYTAAGYTIDRWRMVYLEDDYGLTVNDEFVTLSAGSTKETRLDQFFENSSAYYGETATVSVMLSDGKIYTGTGTIPIPDGKGYVTTFFISRSDVDCLVQAQPTGQLIFRIIAKLGHSVDIAAVKLELGEHSTLKNDAPPSKAEELAKCQRFFQRYRTQSLRPTYADDCRPVMQAEPTVGTITANGTTYYTLSADL